MTVINVTGKNKGEHACQSEKHKRNKNSNQLLNHFSGSQSFFLGGGLTRLIIGEASTSDASHRAASALCVLAAKAGAVVIAKVELG